MKHPVRYSIVTEQALAKLTCDRKATFKIILKPSIKRTSRINKELLLINPISRCKFLLVMGTTKEGIPLLTAENYTNWFYRIKLHFEGAGMWEIFTSDVPAASADRENLASQTIIRLQPGCE